MELRVKDYIESSDVYISDFTHFMLSNSVVIEKEGQLVIYDFNEKIDSNKSACKLSIAEQFP